MKRRGHEERCKNGGKYDPVYKMPWCPLLDKQCAGYDRRCEKFAAERVIPKEVTS